MRAVAQKSVGLGVGEEVGKGVQSWGVGYECGSQAKSLRATAEGPVYAGSEGGVLLLLRDADKEISALYQSISPKATVYTQWSPVKIL